VLREKIFAENNAADDTVFYLGDGGGDFCPSLLLNEASHVLARADYPLHKALMAAADQKSGDGGVAASVHTWTNGADIARIFDEQLLNVSDHNADEN
jgi:pyridoxal phosphate phosphatase PHOSPHO2